ncbi:hypothetical protein HNP84_001940 [Thermocatellispora tengchongensis]|uniref:Uncharacterized protein n=1 Tax=Thermocatellispora tengchongensis TaxID=1073253 RepID=A0A840NU17_9ACTN|nr:hypothetical protein [Thermocatellispora tengchongensis]MBB5132224.1 hypothetical protein [Thermocatellispora tengchongensis]
MEADPARHGTAPCPGGRTRRMALAPGTGRLLPEARAALDTAESEFPAT